MSFLPALATIAIAAVVASTAVSCHGNTGSGILISDYASLKPDQLTMDKCSLELAGSKYIAEIHRKQDGDNVQIDLFAFGSLIESEIYRSNDKEFAIIGGSGEVYDPPIPLIKYPMHVGDQWDWQGLIRTGPVGHPAKSRITTSSENMTVKGESLHDVIRVEVALSIDSGRADTPAQRKLVFWMAPDRGVIKRMFGDYSTRSPLEQ